MTQGKRELSEGFEPPKFYTDKLMSFRHRFGIETAAMLVKAVPDPRSSEALPVAFPGSVIMRSRESIRGAARTR